MARYYYKDGVKIDVEKIGIENFSDVMDAISRDEDVVTITEEELEEEKYFSFWKGIGVGVGFAGLGMFLAAKGARKQLEKQTMRNEMLYSNRTKALKESNE